METLTIKGIEYNIHRETLSANATKMNGIDTYALWATRKTGKAIYSIAKFVHKDGKVSYSLPVSTNF